MLIIGCDHHPGFQQIAFVDTDLGQLHKFGSHAAEPGNPDGVQSSTE